MASEASAGGLLLWQIDATSGFDTAWAALGERSLRAEGFACGRGRRPYWISYELETDDELVTSRLAVAARWDGGTAALDLRRNDAGWTANGERLPDLERALDVDVAGCPLFNSLPTLRHRLHQQEGDHELLMAFVDVPELRITPSEQRYTHMRPTAEGGAVVRYRSGSFNSDLIFDAAGFVLDYPQLGRRLELEG